MAESFLYMTTIGHKTGNPHEIEIWYVEHGEAFYMCAGGREKTHWVQNILANPDVTFSVGTRDNHEVLFPHSPARARVLEQSKEPNLFHIVSSLFTGKYHWSDGLLVEIMPPQDYNE